MTNQRRELFTAAGEPLDVEPAMRGVVPRNRGQRRAIATLPLQSHACCIRCCVQRLICGAVIGCRCHPNRDRDSRRRPVVRTRKEMAADGCAQSLRHLASGGGRSAKKRDELVPARMRNQFAFAEIRARQIEDRAQHRLRVRLTKLVGETSIVIDVGNEQGYRTARRTRLGDRCRGSIDEGVVRSEPSLLIEKNEMLLRAGARSRGLSGFEGL